MEWPKVFSDVGDDIRKKHSKNSTWKQLQKQHYFPDRKRLATINGN